MPPLEKGKKGKVPEGGGGPRGGKKTRNQGKELNIETTRELDSRDTD